MHIIMKQHATFVQ